MNAELTPANSRFLMLLGISISISHKKISRAPRFHGQKNSHTDTLIPESDSDESGSQAESSSSRTLLSGITETESPSESSTEWY